jgi:hypothetical protein
MVDEVMADIKGNRKGKKRRLAGSYTWTTYRYNGVISCL